MWALGLLVVCALLTAPLTLAAGSSDVGDFVEAAAGECHFVNGTQRVRLLQRYVYNQEETVYFDSDVGIYIGKDEFGRMNADRLNKDKDTLAYMRSTVERFCIYNYGIIHSFTADRRVEPSIKISLNEQSNTQQHMLACNVFKFYPPDIEVKWYRNGQEETAQVQFTEPHQNGDWFYQIVVMLETEIQRDDTFTCEVHHRSLEAPLRVHWHPQSSDAAKNKMATGIVGFVLGVVFLIVGAVIYMRGRKVQTSFGGRQSERFLSQ